MTKTFSPIDSSTPFDFNQPKPKIDTSDQKRKASITRTKKWKEALKYIDERKTFYQTFYPGGIPITALSKTDRDAWWLAASVMQNEFDMVKKLFEESNDAL